MLFYFTLSGTRNSYFCVSPRNHRLMFVLWKQLKKVCHKKSNCVFINLVKRKILKVAAFVTFAISIMALFEIYQRFKGHFLNDLCVSFKSYFLLKIPKFLFWLFGHVEKTAWLGRLIPKFMTSQAENKQLQGAHCPISQEVKTIQSDNVMCSVYRMQHEKFLSWKIRHQMWWKNYSQPAF